MRICVIDNASSGLTYDRRWEVVCDELRTYDFVTDVYLVSGDRHTGDYVLGDFSTHATITENLTTYLRLYAKPGTVFIFPNARDPLTFLVKNYSEQFRLKFVLIGFWNDGVFYQEGDLRTKLRGKNYRWSYHYEKSLVECYNYNLVSLQFKLDAFNRTYGTERTKAGIFCALPYSSVIEDVRRMLKGTDIHKDDTLVMNTNPNSVHDANLFKSVQTVLPELRIVNAYEGKYTAQEYRKLLARSKMLLSVNLSDADPYFVVESLVLGNLPILPDIVIYKEMFSEEYLYPQKMTRPPYLNFIRGFENIQEKIWNFEKDSLYYNIEQEAERIVIKYFNSEQLKNILKHIK